MASLYDINEDILSCVDMDTGEIVDVEKLEQLQLAFDDKVEGIALWIKNLLSDAEAIKAEKQKLAERQQQAEKKAESLKKYLSSFLAGNKFETPKVRISYRKSKAVQINDLSQLPYKYLKFSEPTADKTKIKKALESGEELKGVELIENQNMQIK